MLRFLLALSVWFCGLCVSRDAEAWLVLKVRGDDVTIDVRPDGTATVRHQLQMRVRGGPMTEFTVEGVDPDAQFTAPATLTLAASGQAAGAPMALTPRLDGQNAVFELVYKDGVRTGSYLVDFSYETELLKRGVIERVSGGADIAWQSPAHVEGIDSFRVTYRLPIGESPPRLPGVGDDEARTARVALADGVFLTEARREGAQDVFIMTRPHVAKQERVTWRVRVEGEVFGPGPALKAEASTPPSTSLSATNRGPLAPPAAGDLWPLLLGGLYSLLLTVLLLVKAQSRRVRFLVPAKTALRTPLLFALLVTSVVLAVVFEQATPGAGCLVLAMLLMVQVPKRKTAAARAPGTWRTVSFEALEFAPAPRSFRFLDLSHPMGVLWFLLGLGALSVLGLRQLGAAPYHSAMILVYTCAWVVVFCTLGPVTPSSLQQQATVLLRLKQQIHKKLRFQPLELGRFVDNPDSSPEIQRLPDELRLQVPLLRPLAGFQQIELGLEVSPGAGTLCMPVLVVRVREDSPAHEALPRGAQWSRGRQPDERVVLLRPALPDLRMTVDLLKSVMRSLQNVAQPESKPAHESGPRLRAAVAPNEPIEAPRRRDPTRRVA